MMKTSSLIAEQQEQKGNEDSQGGNSQKAPRKSPGDRVAAWKWVKGQSGNPSGRPKRDVAADIARAVFENNPQLLYKALSRSAGRGNAYVFKELADRAYGKVSDKVELTGKDGGPLEYRGMSNADLDERIKQLEVDLGYAQAIDDADRNQTTTDANSNAINSECWVANPRGDAK